MNAMNSLNVHDARDAPGYAIAGRQKAWNLRRDFLPRDATSWAEVFRSEGCWNG